MSKKPTLSLGGDRAAPQLTASSPPASLGKAGANLWRAIMAEYDIRDSGGRAMLQEICEAADRIKQFAAIIKRDGPVVHTKQGPKDHPLLRHEMAARSFIVRSLGRLGLTIEPVGRIGHPTASNKFAWMDDNADE